MSKILLNIVRRSPQDRQKMVLKIVQSSFKDRPQDLTQDDPRFLAKNFANDRTHDLAHDRSQDRY